MCVSVFSSGGAIKRKNVSGVDRIHRGLVLKEAK